MHIATIWLYGGTMPASPSAVAPSPAVSTGTEHDNADAVALLEVRVMGFVRAFGLLEPDTTPCGQPITTSEAHALTDLAGADGRNQKQLGRSLGLEKSTVSRLVSKLEGRGWVRRDPDPRDGRAVLLSLTDDGRRAAERLAAARRRRLTRLLEAIPATDRARVLRALAILGEAARER